MPALDLASTGLKSLSERSPEPFIGRIREQPDLPESERGREILLVRRPLAHLPPGFRGYLLLDDGSVSPGLRDVYVLAPGLRYLAEGDVVRIHPERGALATLYRRASPSNTFLVTERCDNNCLMCSQPPRKQDDSWLVDELMATLPLISPETRELGITGGEPSLLKGRLLELLERMKGYLPQTSVHILTNGRGFADAELARAVAKVQHPDLMLGIPLYSDLPEEHDYVVQALGAFDDTLRGILHLKRARVRVELRCVVHAQTYSRLPQLADFITRNLLFVDHVALMGLELMGFARTNLGMLWVDPLDYQAQLTAAVRTLSRAGLNTSIYNHQLCTLPAELHPFARKSISDWKNVYTEDCEGCVRRDACGGFFASGVLKRSRGIQPFRD
ncbi:His-Xaa-Ser system radical SAM maturase HxsC [Myxococcus llanfairpwllgwyngyllgogerychwyrndrobwllllantysiliogogogochensis]|uniref:His-Xaa-Ser system radical SAM maturase HxsC n=1 Tax=Myxococcus llanfairpwllgwyngyllgogerychwyrndrobwllllantysiliogogogochensis TaxID=2590453 RepID=A0A540WUD7_9BACT|nr:MULTISPECIES: His-Xaa-Ser system radical SAM maturase HxsC [Myxococcus]NTX10818.1 His-Xaa-Ser system radical SAM maturase HxsC [Myxococcus sp. CA056]TQF12628.1 His-Xaa-Ser system radical SAM maturase HxsC [Myxococcus llanfairpwllgwyngyllgogerychwyrndrobwllllantysiliogogogochensis]